MKNKINTEVYAANDISKDGSVLITYAALIYHVIFLFVFLFLGVKPMFYFNIGSVTVFLIAVFLINIKKLNIVPYFISSAEVIAHQICAEYFLGVDLDFHYFILIVASSSFITLREYRRLALGFSILSSMAFVVMELLRSYIVPIYELPYAAAMIIKIVNILAFVVLTIYRLFSYSNITYKLEYNLANKVSDLAKRMQSKNEEIIRIQDNTIYSLSNLVENRDRDTGKHIQRTSAYVRLLAEEVKKAGLYPEYFEGDKISLLERAAPMHDIGKIIVSDTILKKPGKLTDEEFSEMQKHALEGGRIINEVLGKSRNDEYITIASEIAIAHHEKWNGTGYPSGLIEDEIPLSARIMAIADVFDALVSERCYKKAMSDDEAFEVIKQEAGVHFDPELVSIFLKNRDTFVEIKERLKD